MHCHGNAAADSTAKTAALSPVSPTLQMPLSDQNNVFSLNGVSLLQTGAVTGEKTLWKKKKRIELSSGLWVGINCLPVLPKAISSFLVKLKHGPDHVSKGGCWIL